ncbi:DUF6397 family protein [Streptomyces sp. NPDC093085]|uniref:DUF6397 family protein n=1 Tax=Streptomyces sp. NPDC093085 TaxID=3155068 RepID=UPI00341BDFD4
MSISETRIHGRTANGGEGARGDTRARYGPGARAARPGARAATGGGTAARAAAPAGGGTEARSVAGGRLGTGAGFGAGFGTEPPTEAEEAGPGAVGLVRAARELELKRGEFELAVQLGHVRAEPGPAVGRRQVSRREIARLRADEGFPDALRERVRTVGTAEGAALLSVSPARFTRLAKAGLVAPVDFYLNRYRAVVWLYLADELRAIARRESRRLRAVRLPRGLCAGVDESDDRRARNWRGRRIGHLLHGSEDAWERAAIVACVLDSAHVAELVADPYERAYLNRLAPVLFRAYPESEAARSTVGRLLLADHPEEIGWHRASLEALLEEAREARPAPGAEGPTVRAEGAGPPLAVPSGGPLGGLLTRLGVKRERGAVPAARGAGGAHGGG